MLKVVIILCFVSVAQGQNDLPSAAQKVLKDHCYECHGNKRESDPNFDVSDWHYLTKDKLTLVVPGSPKESRIVQRVLATPVEMPPETRTPLTVEEQKILVDWIKEGAKPWEPPLGRKYVDDQYISEMKGLDINKAGRVSLNYRYLSLANLYNDGATDKEIECTQESVSKVMNFLAHGQTKVTPATILDELGLVIRIDLRDYGWTRDNWDMVVQAYPFGNGLRFMRADWFCVNVSQPPLYYALRGIPEDEKDFERMLKIKPASMVRRAGITDSNVAIHNRLFRRFETEDGYYWKSSNIKDDNKSSVLDVDNFKSDYSVSLYSLKNGLLGFAVFEPDEKDKTKFLRQDNVDIDAEFDPTKVVGTPHSTPMISCVTCHTHGLQPNVRDVTGGTAVAFLQQDKERYLRAYQQLPGTLEPLRTVADRYNRPVDLERASADRGMDQQSFGKLISTRQEFIELRPLLEGRTVTRKLWQDTLAKKRVAQLGE